MAEPKNNNRLKVLVQSTPVWMRRTGLFNMELDLTMVLID